MDVPALVISTSITFGIYTILVLSLNWEYGYAGQPNFGKIMFQSAGAYTTGWVSSTILLHVAGTPNLVLHHPLACQTRIILSQTKPLLTVVVFIVSLIASIAVSILLGYLFSLPAIKLGDVYLALFLMVSGEVMRIFVRNYTPLAGGNEGLGGIPHPFAWLSTPGNRLPMDLAFLIMVCATTIGIYIFGSKLVNSPYGRLLRSIRDDDVVAATFGKPLVKVKSQIIMLSSAAAGIAGCYYASYAGYVIADDFMPVKTFTIWLMVLLGGVGNTRGVVLGALTLTLIEKGTSLILALPLPISGMSVMLNYIRNILMGLIMVAILIFRSEGLIPEKPVETPARKVITEPNS